MSAADFVAALDFGGTKIALATATAEGRLLQQARLATRAEDGAVQALRRALHAPAR